MLGINTKDKKLKTEKNWKNTECSFIYEDMEDFFNGLEENILFEITHSTEYNKDRMENDYFYEYLKEENQC